MSELKATPGPWIEMPDSDDEDVYISTEERFDNSKIHICKVQGGFCGAIGEEQEANAHLIAAAPELYEALDKLKLSYEALAHDYEYAVGAGDIHPLHAEHIQRCAAVLAKALGEQA